MKKHFMFPLPNLSYDFFPIDRSPSLHTLHSSQFGTAMIINSPCRF
ncbi:hypothetical protein NC652_022276 [Populus alba x Populus x berolinensis]|nr:hypothetical protein NC652_022276 [Populus alba x Populus x berolinensis]